MSSSSPVELMGWNECFSECCSDVAASLPASGDSLELLYACQSANAARSSKFIGILAGCFGVWLSSASLASSTTSSKNSIK
jgi:hypothetical protein